MRHGLWWESQYIQAIHLIILAMHVTQSKCTQQIYTFLPVGIDLDTLFSCTPFLIELNKSPRGADVADDIVVDLGVTLEFPIEYKITVS